MLQSDAANSIADALEARLRGRTATIAVVGLGYVGLPLARACATAGFTTIGFDTDGAKIAALLAETQLASGPPLAGKQAVAPVVCADLGKSGRLQPTSDPRQLAHADAVIICVPTPLVDGQVPDLGSVQAAARHIAAALRPGQLVVLESTTYPGTTRNVVLPILEKTGLSAGRDFFLAYSPERQDPGNSQFPLQAIPKVVGGLDPVSLRLACALYEQVVERVVRVSSCEVAEASKILENTYRCVNIALVNELKMLFDRLGIDVWEVIAAAATKPFGFQAFYPGPGLGGHCIGIDPFYLGWQARQLGFPVRSIELAGELIAQMPHYVVERLARALAERGKAVGGSRVALLGVAYKKDVDDPRESPAFVLMDLLTARGAVVSYNDPHVPRIAGRTHPGGTELLSTPLTAEYLAEQDCVLIVTDHSAYDFEFIVAHSRLVVDTRGATHSVQHGREKIVRA